MSHRAHESIARVLVVFAASCRACSPAPSADAASADASPAPDGAVTMRGASTSDDVTYDCAGVEPALGAPCTSTSPVGDLVALSDQLTEIAAAHERPSASYWARVAGLLARAESVEVASLSLRERIGAQNSALHLSLVSRTDDARLSLRARDLVARLAYPAASRPSAIEPDPAIERWLGPRAEWTERSVPSRPLFHEMIFEKTRVLRLVRTKTMRANFAQLVAVDDSGQPYLTSVIGSLELRRGFDAVASACVVLLDASRARCDSVGGLEAVMTPTTLPQSHFLAHDDAGHVRCNMCHAPGTPDADIDIDMGVSVTDLVSGDRAAALDDRRSAVLRGLDLALKAPTKN